jgi:signal transduction histidine kinase/CheY-like chemotaxis protein
LFLFLQPLYVLLAFIIIEGKGMIEKTENVKGKSPLEQAEEQQNETKKRAAKHTKGISVYARMLIVIIGIAVVIIAFGNAAGAIFLTRSISGAMEDDLLVTVDIADQFLSKELEILKIKAAEAAADIKLLYTAGEKEGVLEQILAKYPEYSGFSVFNETVLYDSFGEFSVSTDLFYEPFMRVARAGGQAVSNTMHNPDGSLVVYVSAPIEGNYILAAVMPGQFFSNLLSQFRFWQTGHLFINDREGYVVADIRPVWVQERYNFLKMAEADSVYNDLAAMTRRGIAGERGIARYSIDGVPRLCAFRPVSGSDGGWFVAIVSPLAESSLKDIPSGILLIVVITLAMSILAALLGALFLKRPYEEADRLRKDAEAMSISKSVFLANMSHEIRTPMNSIVGFAELALDGETTPKSRDYLQKIQTNAEWLLQIINDILDISKVESGKMELENIPFDMHELFISCRTLIMPKAVEKGITLYFYVEPSIGKRPLGDPTRLRQVLVNLLSNAVKFTNTGMVKLHAALQGMGENTILMHFEIKDSGIGMTGEQIKKVFDPFIQAETGITRKYGGTGLGLAITKNIIEMMGGTLTVESTPGVGSKFSFDLTFDTIDVSDDEMIDNKIVINELEKPVFSGEILLCEDNTMNQQVICEHLARVGFKTVVAENGKIGYEMVKSRKERGEKQFDLVFMDMHMPVMDGLEASSKIMELKTGVPVVAMTANIMTNDREIYRIHGMNDCVGKPFTSQELWRCLMKYFTPVSGDLSHRSVQVEADAEYMRSIQLHFVKNNQNRYREITDALESGDIMLAHRLAHSLKSNAGQIGRIILQKAAAEVENQLKEGKNKVSDSQLITLDNELNVVLTELAPLLAEESEKKKTGKENHDPLTALDILEKLEPLLKRGNPECMNFKEDLRAIQGGEQLIRQMEDFEFDSALKTLEKIKERMV